VGRDERKYDDMAGDGEKGKFEDLKGDPNLFT